MTRVLRGKAGIGMAIPHWPTVQLDSAADTLHNQTRIFARLVLALKSIQGSKFAMPSAEPADRQLEE
jgi:hypothetical protein